MKTHHHALIGAAVAVLPDAALALFGWRRAWLPETHRLVRVHRFLHSVEAVPFIIGLAYASHLFADHYSEHRTGPP